MTSEFRQPRRAWHPGTLTHRTLGVDSAQVGLKVAHTPTAVAAQFQVAMALVGALHQQRDLLGLRLRLRLRLRLGLRLGFHACGVCGSAALKDAEREATRPSETAQRHLASLGRAPPSRVPFKGAAHQGPTDSALCGCSPLAETEVSAQRGPINARSRAAMGRAEREGAS